MRRKKNMRPGHQIDLSGLMVPVSVLQANQKFREIKTGETLEMLNCNHETLKMFLQVIPETAYELLSDRKMRETSSLYRIRLKKTKEI